MLKPGEHAPEFALTERNGAIARLADVLDRSVILFNFSS
jgi:peroxiredoxin